MRFEAAVWAATANFGKIDTGRVDHRARARACRVAAARIAGGMRGREEW